MATLIERPGEPESLGLPGPQMTPKRKPGRPTRAMVAARRKPVPVRPLVARVKTGPGTKTPGSGLVAKVEIRLDERHYVNGVQYGPGRVHIRQDIARELLSAEDRVRDNRQRELHPLGGIIKLGYGSPIVQRVDLDYFRDAYDAEVRRVEQDFR